MDTLGFIGIGIMGKPMVENLLTAGYQVNAYARRPSSIDSLAISPTNVFNSPCELAAASDIIFSCVADTADVEQVLLDNDGVIEGIQPGALVIDMSTISPQATQVMAQRFHAVQASMLDAPVSGGEIGAINASLSIMVGGQADDFDRALPIFECLGKNIIHIGDHGAGQVAKACNQILVAQTMNAVAEAFLLAQSAQVDAARVREALLGGFAYSKILEVHGQRMLSGDYQPGFKTSLHAKDLRIAAETAAAYDIEIPGAHMVNAYMQELVANGDGDLDSSAIAKIVGSG